MSITFSRCHRFIICAAYLWIGSFRLFYFFTIFGNSWLPSIRSVIGSCMCKAPLKLFKSRRKLFFFERLAMKTLFIFKMLNAIAFNCLGDNHSWLILLLFSFIQCRHNFL